MQFRNPTLIKGRQGRWLAYPVALLIIAAILSSNSFSVSENNGFDLSDTLIPRNEIHHGGPGRDGIPAIDEPEFIDVSEVTFLKPDDRVLGLVYENVVHAYPIKILNYHEIVNDRIKGQAFVISYCPLCGSGMAFKPTFNVKDTSFGVSGLLYNSDMLLYDRHSESLWSQIMGMAISGEFKGQKLPSVALVSTSWKNWSTQYPQTKVLSTRTGYYRNYENHPYGNYDVNAALYFPVKHSNARYHPKERVIGLSLKGQHKVYPFSELAKQGKAIITDTFAGQALQIHYDNKSHSAMIYNANKQALPATSMFWFAWVTFYPDTAIYTAR